jgi:hypothetical protein
LRGAQALEHGFDHRRELEAALRVEHGRVAHLHVADVLAGGVLGELVGDAGERVGGLHHAEGDVERLQVLDERAAVATEVHRLAEAVLVGRGEDDLLFVGELEDGRETKRAVEVNVEVRLGELLDELERECLRHGGRLAHSGLVTSRPNDPRHDAARHPQPLNTTRIFAMARAR